MISHRCTCQARSIRCSNTTSGTSPMRSGSRPCTSVFPSRQRSSPTATTSRGTPRSADVRSTSFSRSHTPYSSRSHSRWFRWYRRRHTSPPPTHSSRRPDGRTPPQTTSRLPRSAAWQPPCCTSSSRRSRTPIPTSRWSSAFRSPSRPFRPRWRTPTSHETHQCPYRCDRYSCSSSCFRTCRIRRSRTYLSTT